MHKIRLLNVIGAIISLGVIILYMSQFISIELKLTFVISVLGFLIGSIPQGYKLGGHITVGWLMIFVGLGVILWSFESDPIEYISNILAGILLLVGMLFTEIVVIGDQ